MAEDDRKLRFIEAATQAMAEHASPFLTQVVGVGGEEEGQPLCTGFFCEFQGRKLIATAAHVISDLKGEGHQGVVFTRGEGEAPAVVDGEVVVFEEVDLAVYLPGSDFPLPSTKKHWPEGRIERDPTSIRRDYLVLTGFPRRFSRRTRHFGGVIFSEAMTYGAMMRYREEDVPEAEREEFDRDLPDYPFLPADLLKPHEFAIHFDATPEMFLGRNPDPDDPRGVEDRLGVFEEGPSSKLRTFSPTGLSGSPVFRLGSSGVRADDWTPDRARLVGVATQWLSAHKILVATSSATLLEALAKATGGEDG